MNEIANLWMVIGTMQSRYNEDEALRAAIAASEAQFAAELKQQASLQRVLSDSKVQSPVDPRDSKHLTLYHYQPKASGKSHFKVKIPGGGNCGFYAVALGVINFIVQDKIALIDQKYSELSKLFKKGKARDDINARLEFYRTGSNPKQLKPPRLKKCVPFIEKILKDIDAGELDSLDQLKAYILQNMHSQKDKDYFLESMLIVLGPVLREVSVLECNQLKEAEKKIEEKGKEKKSQSAPVSTLLDVSGIEMQPKDGVNAPEEQLNLLSGFFGFEFRAYLHTPRSLYFKSFEANEASQQITNPIALVPASSDEKAEFKKCKAFIELKPGSPVVQVIYNPVAQHWDLLLPQEELQRPPYLFSPFNSLMIEDEVAPAIMSVPQYISSKREADYGKQAFDPDSYVLIAEESCDFVSMSAQLDPKDLNKLPKTRSNAVYVRSENQLFYVNKAEKKCTEVRNSKAGWLNQFDTEMKSIGIKDKAVTLTKKQLEKITSITDHSSGPSVWHLVYVDNEGVHHPKRLNEIKDLREAIEKLPKQDVGSIEKKDKEPVAKVFDQHINKQAKEPSTIDKKREENKKAANSEEDVFDETQLPADLEKIIAESRKDQKKLFSFHDSITAFEDEVKKITNKPERKVGEELIKTLRGAADTLIDQTQKQSNSRVAAYEQCLKGVNKVLTEMPSMTPSCANTLLNIIAGILSIGIWHGIQRYQTGQWTLFNDLKASLYQTKRELELLAEKPKKLDDNHNITPGADLTTE